MNVLAVVDTPSIRKYIFETPHLVEIEGASALLDRLNRIVLPQLLGAKTVYANGGSGQFIFENKTMTEVVEALRRAEGLYYNATHGGATLAWAAVPYKGSYKACVQEAFAQLRAKRDLTAPLHLESALPLVKLCESCRTRPASCLYPIPEDIWLCPVCKAKIE